MIILIYYLNNNHLGMIIKSLLFNNDVILFATPDLIIPPIFHPLLLFK